MAREPLDKRTWRLVLTEHGRAEFLALDRRSSESIWALLAPFRRVRANVWRPPCKN